MDSTWPNNPFVCEIVLDKNSPNFETEHVISPPKNRTWEIGV